MRVRRRGGMAHLASLADAMDAVDGLLLNEGVPPRLKEDDCAGARQVEPNAALERHEEHWHRGLMEGSNLGLALVNVL